MSFSVKHGAHVLYSEICKASERNASKPHSGHLKFAPLRILQRSVFSQKKNKNSKWKPISHFVQSFKVSIAIVLFMARADFVWQKSHTVMYTRLRECVIDSLSQPIIVCSRSLCFAFPLLQHRCTMESYTFLFVFYHNTNILKY